MPSRRNGEEPASKLANSGLLTRQFLGSPEFTVGYLATAGLLLGVIPALAACFYHLARGNLAFATGVGVVGVGIGGVCSWRLAVALTRAHNRYGFDGETTAPEQ